MKLVSVALSILLCLTVSSHFGQTTTWRTLASDIQFLEDSYDDVVKKLGPPLNSPEKDLSEYFDLSDSKINALFASGKCVETSYSHGELVGWKVPRWTVIEISVSLKEPLRLKHLKFDLKDFEKRKIEDGPEFAYENERAGVYFTLWRDGKVRSITYTPPSNLWDKRC